MGLIETVGKGPLALDSCIFIYFLERHPVYLPLVRPLFVAAAAGRLQITTSAITLLEVLVQPIRLHDLKLAVRYSELVKSARGLRVVPITRSNLAVAAVVRAETRMPAPDSLQIAAVNTTGCKWLLTNDKKLKPALGVKVLQLDDFKP